MTRCLGNRTQTKVNRICIMVFSILIVVLIFITLVKSEAVKYRTRTELFQCIKFYESYWRLPLTWSTNVESSLDSS